MSPPPIVPRFLSRRQVDARHRTALSLHGGAGGIRSESALATALAAPLHDYLHGEADLCGIASAYAFHLAHAQPYNDGNKRTGAACALAFLELNGIPTERATRPLYNAFVAIAEKRMSKAVLAKRLRALFGRKPNGIIRENPEKREI